MEAKKDAAAAGDKSDSPICVDEDLSRMVGEGEWQKPLEQEKKAALTRQFSTGPGFQPKASAAERNAAPFCFADSGIYVPGLKHWNAATNAPVLTEEEGRSQRHGQRGFQRSSTATRASCAFRSLALGKGARILFLLPFAFRKTWPCRLALLHHRCPNWQSHRRPKSRQDSF